LIVTGGEGDGKSTLLRQLAFGCALGLDPLATNLLERTHEPRTTTDPAQITR
jgi:predicted ATPase